MSNHGIGFEGSRDEDVSRGSRLGIVENILKVALNGATMTEIKYKARLPQDLLDEIYLPYCLRDGFLGYQEKTNVYLTTEKGRQYLKRYDALKKALSS